MTAVRAPPIIAGLVMLTVTPGQQAAAGVLGAARNRAGRRLRAGDAAAQRERHHQEQGQGTNVCHETSMRETVCRTHRKTTRYNHRLYRLKHLKTPS